MTIWPKSLGLERKRGEIVQMVEPDQGADKAGLEAGDIVVSINGRPVTSEQTLSFLVANITPGTTIPIEVIRRGESKILRATVGKRPSDEELRNRQMFSGDDQEQDVPDEAPGASPIIESLGVQVIEINAEIARQLGVARDTKGLAILQVDPNSDAAAKGLRRRDMILTANYKPVETAAALEAEIKAASAANRDAVLLRIQRPGAGGPRYAAVRLRR